VVPFRLKLLLQVIPFLLLMVVVSPRSEAGTVPPSIDKLASASDDVKIDAGKVVYVDFWASWCVPCRQSFPWMSELMKKYGDKGLQIIAINVDKDRKAADKFLKDNKAGFPILYDPAGNLAKLYNLEVMPSSFLYGRDGKLKSQKQGFNAKETESVEALIRELLEEKPKK